LIIDSSNLPSVSVVVRSYNRINALCELLTRLLKQDYFDFQIIIVEQSTNHTESDLQQLSVLTRDPRIELLNYPPLGGPAARNIGVKYASGDIVILIDDDDLPVRDDWISTHVSYYSDPNLIGLTARHVRTSGESCPYVMPTLVSKLCMIYTPLKTPIDFVRFDKDVDRIDRLHGTNSSFRRERIIEAGLWDETVQSHDEHSLFFKLQKIMNKNEYLAFKAHPPALKRVDIQGGMDKRYVDLAKEIDNRLNFLNKIVRKYFPLRYNALLPFYFGYICHETMVWIWDGNNGRLKSYKEKIIASSNAIVMIPQRFLKEYFSNM